MATRDRWDAPGWWPTKGTPSMRDYVGPSACTPCHSEIAASQQRTHAPSGALGPRFQDSAAGSRSQVLDEVYNYVARTADGMTVCQERTVRSPPMRLGFGLSESSQTLFSNRDTFAAG
jgi:hypothetical protein